MQILENKKGTSLVTGLLISFLGLVFLTALIPGLVDVIDDSKTYSTGLNCKGAVDYNGTVNPNGSGGEKSVIACRALDLAIPFIVLGVVFASIMLILYGPRRQEAPPGYSQY